MIYKLLSIFFLLSTCKAPIRAYFDGFSGRRGETEFSEQEWQRFVENPIEGRVRLRGVCESLGIGDKMLCLEFRFDGDLIDPQPVQDGGSVIISMVESKNLNIKRRSLSDNLHNLEIHMKTSDEAGLVFYLRGGDDEYLDKFLEKYISSSGCCCSTYFKDCLYGSEDVELNLLKLHLIKILFYQDGKKFMSYEEDGRTYGMTGAFNRKVFNFFRANGEAFIEKVFEVLSRYEEMPYTFKEIVFATNWLKINECTPESFNMPHLSQADPEMLMRFIPPFSEALNTLNLVPNHPKLEPKATVEEFGDLFRAWYVYGAE